MTHRFGRLALCLALFSFTLACGDDGPTGPTEPSVQQAVFRTQPTDATAGQAINPAVQVALVDSAGNVVEGARRTVTLSLGANPENGSLNGATTVDAVNGMATFSNVWVDRAASGYTLSASVSGVSDTATSNNFAISPAAPEKLAFRTQPANTLGQDTISPDVEVEVQDEFGNFVSSASPDITVTLADSPGGRDSLAGTKKVSASSGVAAFSDLSLARPGDGFTLKAEAIGLRSVESAPFSINLNFVQTDAGAEHTCGVTDRNLVYCWGSNSSGQLGDATFEDRNRPMLVRPAAGLDLDFVAVDAGFRHTCAVTSGNEAFCWGDNAFGQLGQPQAGQREANPIRIDGSLSITQISAGGNHTCAVTTGGDPYCWGANSRGQVGDGTTTDRPSPTAVQTTENFALVTAGSGHSCGVNTSDDPFCWGENDDGELGDGSTTDRPTPVAVDVSGLSTQAFARINAGDNHTCGVTTAEGPFCWGKNSSGQLGDGTTTNRTTPTAVQTTESFTLISAGGSHSCGTTSGDEAFCWGENSSGQLGVDNTSNFATPVPVFEVPETSDQRFALISAGGTHTCGLTVLSNDEPATCWGANLVGQVGDGTTTARLSPVLVIQ